MKLPETREDLRNRWESGERFLFYFFYGHKPPNSGVDASCLSQWFVRPFAIDKIEYPTSEHWMMAEKARLFGDREMLTEILNCNSPKEAKAFGRKVTGFDQDIWNQHKYEIVKRGNREKFSQHDDLKAFLLETANQVSLPLGKAAELSEDYDLKSSKDDPASGDEVRERLGRYQIYKNRTNVSDGQSDPEDALSHQLGARVILVEAAGRDTIWGIGLGKNNPKSLDPFTWRGQNLLGFALTAVRDSID